MQVLMSLRQQQHSCSISDVGLWLNWRCYLFILVMDSFCVWVLVSLSVSNGRVKAEGQQLNLIFPAEMGLKLALYIYSYLILLISYRGVWMISLSFNSHITYQLFQKDSPSLLQRCESIGRRNRWRPIWTQINTLWFHFHFHLHCGGNRTASYRVHRTERNVVLRLRELQHFMLNEYQIFHDVLLATLSETRNLISNFWCHRV